LRQKSRAKRAARPGQEQGSGAYRPVGSSAGWRKGGPLSRRPCHLGCGGF